MKLACLRRERERERECLGQCLIILVAAAPLFFVRGAHSVDDMATGGGLETRVSPLASPRSFLIASTKDLSISITGKVNERWNHETYLPYYTRDTSRGQKLWEKWRNRYLVSCNILVHGVREIASFRIYRVMHIPPLYYKFLLILMRIQSYKIITRSFLSFKLRVSNS